MRFVLVFGLLCSGLAACAIAGSGPMVPPAPISPAPTASAGGLAAARRACNAAFPPQVGNYLPHAECVNAAIEHHALPHARYPDLVRLQEQVRSWYSAQIDEGTITPKTAETKMDEADELVARATHERDAGRSDVADAEIAPLQTLLQR